MRSTTYALDSTWRPLLKDLGVAPADVLRRAALPEDLLARSEVRLDAAAFHRFWDSLGQALDDPCFPLRVCQAVRSESFSPALFAALCSPHYLVAVQRIARFKALVAPMRLEIEESAQQVRVGLVWPDAGRPPPASLVITELLFFVALMRMGTREPVCPRSVTTAVPPSPAAPYTDFLGVRMQRGPKHQVTFAREDALRPFLTTNDGLWAAFEPELRARLAELDAEVTVGQRVRATLLEALPSGMGDIDAVSRRLAMSPRTLQRHLEAEGTRFSRILQDTRQSLALHYLHKTGLPAAEISFLLGFEEPNSFYRAFRAWTGQTPERIREQAPPRRRIPAPSATSAFTPRPTPRPTSRPNSTRRKTR